MSLADVVNDIRSSKTLAIITMTLIISYIITQIFTYSTAALVLAVGSIFFAIVFFFTNNRWNNLVRVNPINNNGSANISNNQQVSNNQQANNNVNTTKPVDMILVEEKYKKKTYSSESDLSCDNYDADEIIDNMNKKK